MSTAIEPGIIDQVEFESMFPDLPKINSDGTPIDPNAENPTDPVADAKKPTTPPADVKKPTTPPVVDPNNIVDDDVEDIDGLLAKYKMDDPVKPEPTKTDPAKPDEKIKPKDIKIDVEYLQEQLEDFGFKIEDTDTKETINQKILDAIENYGIASINSVTKDLPIIAKNFIDYVAKGGTVNEFFDYLQTTVKVDDLKDDTLEGRQQIVRVYLDNVKGLNKEEIEEIVTTKTTKNTLDDFSEKAFTALKKIADEEKKEIDRTLAEKQNAQKQRQVEFSTNIDDIFKSKVLDGITIDSNLKNYITKPIKTNDGKVILPLLSDINKILYPRTKEDYIKLVKLSAVLNNNFDFSKIAAKEINQAASEVIAKKLQLPSQKK